MCHCVKLLTLFKIRGNTGKIYKTCIKCNERFKCGHEGCNYSSCDNRNLQNHIKAVHALIRDFECDWEGCDYKCSMEHNLKKHIKTIHYKIRDFECDWEGCNYKGSTDSNLKQHIDCIHKNIREFECNWEGCDYACTRDADLKKHIKRVHDKIRDLKCERENCNYACTTNEDLKKHIKQVHDKIKDIKCPDCNYACSTNEQLKQHIKRVHDKIKDFECSKCDYKCSANGDLQKHIEICTGARNISSGEFKMIECFEELGFYENEDYIHDSTFEELTTYCGRHLRFDFMFINHKRVFEFEGIPHFIPQRFGGMSQEEAEERFRKQQENDKLKDDFCKENGYKMVRISYKDYPNILSILHAELMDIMDNDE
jgi:hypothetical protein